MERTLGDGIWDAVQPELGRRVALRRLERGAPFVAERWPDREGVVRLFAVVTGADGTYLATRFISGARTLAERGAARPARRRRWLAEVADILDGTVHGDLTDHDILIDPEGRAWVTGFGRAPAGATAADDRAALQRLRAAPARRWRALAVLAAAVVAAAAVVFILGRGSPAPAPPEQGIAFGSSLAAAEVTTVDCAGVTPSVNSLPCTIVQARLPGARLVAQEASTLRRWAVRGVRGRVALQIQRPVGTGYTTIANTGLHTVTDPSEVAYFDADRPVPKGARFALEVAPATGVGIADGVSGAATERFFSPLRRDVRQPETAGGEGQELLLRVDVVPRAR